MQPRQFAKPLLAQLFMGLLDGWCNRKYHVVQFDIGARMAAAEHHHEQAQLLHAHG